MVDLHCSIILIIIIASMVSRTEACTRTNHVATQDNDKLFQLSEEIGKTNNFQTNWNLTRKSNLSNMLTASSYPLSMTTTAFHELSTYEVKTTTTSQFETKDDLKDRNINVTTASIIQNNFSASKRTISKDETTKMQFSSPIEVTEMKILQMNANVTHDQIISSESYASQHSSPSHQASAVPLFTTKDDHILVQAIIQNSVTDVDVKFTATSEETQKERKNIFSSSLISFHDESQIKPNLSSTQVYHFLNTTVPIAGSTNDDLVKINQTKLVTKIGSEAVFQKTIENGNIHKQSNTTNAPLEKNNFIDLDPSTARKGVVSSVLNKLREIIRKAVNNVMRRRVDSENYDDMSEEALIVLVNFEIESGILMRLIDEELVNKLGDTNVSVDYIDEIVEDLLPGIRRIILLEISLWKVGNINSVKVV